MHNAPRRRLVNKNPSASVGNRPRMAVQRASIGPQNIEGIAIALFIHKNWSARLIAKHTTWLGCII